MEWTNTPECSTIYHDLPCSARFWSFLFAVDNDLSHGNARRLGQADHVNGALVTRERNRQVRLAVTEHGFVATESSRLAVHLPIGAKGAGRHATAEAPLPLEPFPRRS